MTVCVFVRHDDVIPPSTGCTVAAVHANLCRNFPTCRTPIFETTHVYSLFPDAPPSRRSLWLTRARSRALSLSPSPCPHLLDEGLVCIPAAYVCLDLARVMVGQHNR